ncbi:MAG: SUMF1/EgtB/PvdO family nonheme iron enzyme [Pyrinomonadaceae bacterium]
MPQVTSPPLRIFICYRRDNPDGHTGRLGDHLHARFGDENVFMDVEKIRPGRDFRKVIDEALANCEVLLALIDQNWLTRLDEDGRRRLDNLEDYVRLEIVTALECGVGVIPVVLPGARMPRKQDLPENMWALAHINAVVFSNQPGHWRHDVEELIRAIEELVTERRREKESPPAPPPPRPVPEPAAGKLKSAFWNVVLGNRKFILLNVFLMLAFYVIPVGVPLIIKLIMNRRVNIQISRIRLPGDGFRLGSTDEYGNPRPGRQVTFDKAIVMGVHEVTQAEWAAVMGDNPSENRGDDKPVEWVSWDDTQTFITKLNIMEKTLLGNGRVYALPTEAEWEYACKEGQARNPGGRPMHTREVTKAYTNDFEQYGMLDNVQEWCQDVYYEDYSETPRDGSKAAPGPDSAPRVVRGGAFDGDAGGRGCSVRKGATRGDKDSKIGLRLVVRYENP